MSKGRVAEREKSRTILFASYDAKKKEALRIFESLCVKSSGFFRPQVSPKSSRRVGGLRPVVTL